MTATDTTETTVRITGERAEEFDVRDLGDRIAIIAPKGSGGFFGKDPRHEIVVEVPVASALTAKVGSSDVAAHGALRRHPRRLRLGRRLPRRRRRHDRRAVRFGRPVAEHLAGEARIKSGSGDIRVHRADSGLVVTSGSGDVRVDSASGEVAVKTGSGDAQLGSVTGDVVFTTGSGDLTVAQASSGRVTAKTASGDVRIGVASGTPVWTDVRTASGRLSSSLPSTGEPAADQPFLEVRATTASGDVTLHQS